jgi:hypothetical protein
MPMMSWRRLSLSRTATVESRRAGEPESKESVHPTHEHRTERGYGAMG